MTEHLRASPPERYEEISQQLLEQAQEELDRGDILQASEKMWGATAHAVKAHSQQRGWNYHAHGNIRDAANYIATERNRRDLVFIFAATESLHSNYYEHQLEASEVQVGLDYSAIYIQEMAGIRLSEPPTNQDHLTLIERADQENRLRRLTRESRFSHGPEFNPEEVADLPPVRPAPPTAAR